MQQSYLDSKNYLVSENFVNLHILKPERAQPNQYRPYNYVFFFFFVYTCALFRVGETLIVIRYFSLQCYTGNRTEKRFLAKPILFFFFVLIQREITAVTLNFLRIL